MNRKLLAVSAVCILLNQTQSYADDWPQWRGPSRNGISKETGLLKQWPKEGPKLLWTSTTVGQGYSAPAVAGGKIYLLGNEGLENEFVQAIDARTGKELWRTRLGNVGNPNQKPNFPAARSTPTVSGDVLYALGSDGDLACVEASNGKVRWHKNLRTDFAGKPGEWAYAESPLLDGKTLVCTPGGTEATIAGLKADSGGIAWKCPLPEGDEAAYSSPIIVETGNSREYVQLLQKGLVGIDAGTGKFLWRYAKPISPYDANIPTPVADKDIIYVASAGAGGGAVKLRLADSKPDPEQLYFEPKLPTAIGGSIKVGDYLYGTTAQAMICANFQTGQVKWQERSLGAASLCCAEGLLYLHGENGEVALVTASPEGYQEQGRFAPPNQPKHSSGMEKSWAYPVIANGQLLIRDHGVLWVYDVMNGRS